MSRRLRVHSFESSSRANGPGRRACLWLQGCTLACGGCFNAETHDTTGGQMHSAEEILSWILALNDIEGITVSGGEPLQQPDALMELLGQLRLKSDLSVVLFTGFTREELERSSMLGRLETVVDVLIAGRYESDKALRSGLIGSSNKHVLYLSDRYSEKDLIDVPVAEVIISPDGEVAISGIDPLALR